MSDPSLLRLGTSPEGGGPVELPMATLLRHAVCLGSSGSGKTVAAKVMCEEFARRGVPVLALDPQGDIASLALPAAPEAVAAKGTDPAWVEEYRRRVEVVIWTPASSIGIPLSVNPLGALDAGAGAKDGEERLRALSATAQGLASLLGYDLAGDDGRCAAGALHLVLDHVSRNRPAVKNFEALGGLLGQLPSPLAGEVAKLLDERRQEQLRRKVHLLSVGAQQLLFQMGVPLDIPTLLGLGGERTRISVIYLNTLHTQAEKEFLVAQVAGALYDWMLDHPADRPQALFYMDEVAPYLPPVEKPACKESLALLFKQARKYGIACLLASQNPGDVDYKSLAQFSTWLLGRMMVRQDIHKVQQVIKSIAGAETERVVGALPSLAPGRFRLLSPDAFPRPVDLQVRWLLTEHKTLDEEGVARVTDPALRESLLARARAAEFSTPAPASATVPEETGEAEGEEEAAEAGEPSLAERIERHLVAERRALTTADLAGELGAPEGAVRRALRLLEDGKKIQREKAGRCYWHWARAYRFFPDHGIARTVQVARLATYESEALGAAKSATSRLFGLVQKDLEAAEFRHLPLWQVRLTVRVSSGLLFWKRVATRAEFLYFHARTGDLLVAGPRGIEFVSVVDRDPAEIRDLDDVCAFEEKTPDEVGLDRKALKAILPEKEAVALAQRKFPIQVEACRLAFLPYWSFAVRGENKGIAIDGLLGQPFCP